MDSRNYACDYNFDWVEKMQPFANKVFDFFFCFIERKQNIFIFVEYHR